MAGVRRPSTRGLPASVGIGGTLDAGGKAMRKAAEIIAADARARASWSKRIPPSVRVSVAADGKSAVVTAGGGEAPMAFTFEAPGGKWVAHPVYARGLDRREWTWVTQVPRPFLAPAGEAQATRAADAWGEQIITAWVRATRFRT